jgi:hypothetical protein
MEKLLKPRTIEQCVLDAWFEMRLKPYLPFAKSFVIVRRLALQYWKEVYNRLPWGGMFLVLFTILMTHLFR